jgi:hypothetical protein
MGYGVTFVHDDDLPPEHAWVVARIAGECHLFVKASAVSPAVLAEAWAGSRLLHGIVPRQRVPSDEVVESGDRLRSAG